MQATFILHRRPFRETSLILEVLTKEYGKVSLLAKGAHSKRSNLSSILQPFIPLQCSWVGGSGLYTLTDAETLPIPLKLTGVHLYCAMYLSELVCHLLHQYDPHPIIFADYQTALEALGAGDRIEPVLRYFEFSLLSQLGYGIQTGYEAQMGEPVQADKLYNYRLGQGLYEVTPDKRPINSGIPLIQGATLIALANQQLHNQQQLKQAKLLMRYAIHHYLGGKPLKSKTLFQSSQLSN